MSSSNNDSLLSSTNDSSLISSSSQLQTPPKQKNYNSTSSLLSQQGQVPTPTGPLQLPQLSQSQPRPSNSSALFFSDEIVGTGTPILLSKLQLQTHQLPNTAPPFSVDNSILRTETPDLDIDLALGDLNLDDYNDFLTQNQSFSAQHENRSLMNLGSMTPNAQASLQFHPSTPTWTSVLPAPPQTAPPFNHGSLNNSTTMLDKIKSFKMPDYGADSETTSSSDNTGSAGPHQFGGSLLAVSNSLSSASKESKLHQQEAQTQLQLHQQHHLPQFMPYNSLEMYNGFPSQLASFGQHAQQSNSLEGMWNGSLGTNFNTYMVQPSSQQQAVASASIPGVGAGVFDPLMQQRPLDSQLGHLQHHQQASSRQQLGYRQRQMPALGSAQNAGLQQQRWTNNGVNVHRNKMNTNGGNGNNNGNNRKRGEDPSKYANAKLEDFKGDIYSLCKDQHGCRFLQKQLDLNDDAKTTLIFNETYLHIVELMVDPFGNYLIQKLLEKCNDQQRAVLVKNASSDFFKTAVNPHGTRALQKLIECVNSEEESLVITESLKPHIVTLSRDLNGNHVVQKCLAKLSPNYTQFIFDICSENCVEIARHRHGCCVLQRCLDFGTFDQCRQLGSVLSRNVVELSFDPFGNYVVQYILNNNELIESNDKCIEDILTQIKLKFISLSLHKFGSNVIEKILRLPKINAGLVQLILNDLSIKEFNKLLNDSYGNYVLQTCLDVSNFENFEKLKEILIPILPSVKNTPHGRRISARLGINLNNLNISAKENHIVPAKGGIAKVES